MTRAVRQATTDDIWAIHVTARESWHAAYDDLLGRETVDDVVDEWYAIGDLESSISDASEREDAVFLIAEDRTVDDAFAGDCLGFAQVVPWPEDVSVGYLTRLYVHPDVWGEGVGTALLERLETALERTFDRLRLAVLADNDSGIAFYDAAGFDHVTTRETDLADGLEECVYEKSL
ncbi:GNAT family N-acetyltransferase [Natronorubrum sulfidifaciens]|uniref:N-acetyltransferase GCN5 n=1 Tax=Natronorubrum sulfidifaciens JCM 14089 TaxID=1230460 RepID=L9WDC8_9EURY|nr:GNAT family N-acetyltransferase [Natronorubrum sulfidifaciens]ELY47485.1 N-acetyltransferase GCN5 [Natronorubrum sulfidifaciens JCM 14089]